MKGHKPVPPLRQQADLHGVLADDLLVFRTGVHAVETAVVEIQFVAARDNPFDTSSVLRARIKTRCAVAERVGGDVDAVKQVDEEVGDGLLLRRDVASATSTAGHQQGKIAA